MTKLLPRPPRNETQSKQNYQSEQAVERKKPPLVCQIISDRPGAAMFFVWKLFCDRLRVWVPSAAEKADLRPFCIFSRYFKITLPKNFKSQLFLAVSSWFFLKNEKHHIFMWCFSPASFLATQVGAADGSRTRTPIRTQAPQACQSTNSSTAANYGHLYIFYILYYSETHLSTGIGVFSRVTAFKVSQKGYRRNSQD